MKAMQAWRLLGLVVVLLLLWLGYRALDQAGVLEQLGDVQALQQWLLGYGRWGPVLIVALMALAIVINPIPSAPIALAAGAVYGHAWGTLYVVTGAEIGALIAFTIARLLGQDLLQRWLGERVRLGWIGSQNALTALVFVSRLLPFISFDLVSYGAGLTSLRSWRFALATLLGLIPMSFLLAHFGSELAATELGAAATTLLLLGLLVLLPLVYRLLSGPARTPPDD